MNETPTPTAQASTPSGHGRQIPRTKLWIIAGLFLIVAFSMYAGTMYRIKHYGYVGINDDRPITAPASKTSPQKPN